MKNKILLIVLICISISCSNDTKRFALDPSNFPNTPTIWKIDKIEFNTNSTSLYHIIPRNEQFNLNVEDTWFCDSIGRFIVGDTLKFIKIK